MSYDMPYDMTHTFKSIAESANTTERTVRRWATKHPDIGRLVNNVRHFSDTERDLLLSHQAKPKEQEVIEAELVEPGAITLRQSGSIEARPLISFDLAPIELNTTALDTTALDTQTQQYQQQA